jgi:hypothetical protein
MYLTSDRRYGIDHSTTEDAATPNQQPKNTEINIGRSLVFELTPFPRMYMTAKGTNTAVARFAA